MRTLGIVKNLLSKGIVKNLLLKGIVKNLLKINSVGVGKGDHGSFYYHQY